MKNITVTGNAGLQHRNASDRNGWRHIDETATKMTAMKQHNRDSAEQDVRTTLGLLDSLDHIEPHHLFRARVMKRIDEENSSLHRLPFNARHGVKMALMALLLAVNAGSAFLVMQSTGENRAVDKDEVIASLSSEYSSPALSYYIDRGNEELASE
ncbi:MAG: hypothetical protein J7D60_01295 [Prosthecochloris sp.]|nr:hypothetical protein [Prosthecochloris sp.]